MSAPQPGETVDPKPSLDKTYRWADGGECQGEYGWMTDDVGFQDEVDDAWEPQPRQMLVETWERLSVEVVTLYPRFSTCQVEDGEGQPCEAEAVTWEQEGETWHPLCAEHRGAIDPSVLSGSYLTQGTDQ